ncbi:condensin-2 complex subunit G2 [Brachionichthys hirsutus]|uniref:condensin-2 complex subunit G2 n=1 Tax=Brachionichthys hirsutus TaxID=412623 RepID=UPI0036043AF6
MSKREAFSEAACKENVEDFLRFIRLHKDKTEPFDVEEVLQEMPSGQRQSLWRKLASLLQDVLQELPPDRWEEETESAADPKPAMAVLDGVTLVATLSVKVLQDGDAYSALVEIAHRLQDVLASLPVSETPLQLRLHALCEAWWKKDLPEKERFGRTAFLVSLQKSFILKKPGVEIQRVWSLHDVLPSLDYSSEDNKQIVDALLQSFHRPTSVRSDDGKRFLVFLFSWKVDFIGIIHRTIKNQLVFYSKSITAHIMEIYFRAWRKASGEFQERIESSCVQDLMQNAIFLYRSSPVHAKVRQIVCYFHTRKGCRQVDKMLHNLYKPILWKALSAPNFEVRANATFLFTDAFPLHDPDQNAKNIDEAVQKQLDTAMGLLDDPHPTVRSNATLGVCKILAKCWELLPPAIIADFLKKLVVELAADSSSPDVRCSVFKCLTIVLDNTLSHPILEQLLPTLKYSLHDNSEKVRTAFLDMLIKVKAMRAAKFWDVCKMDHLLARLAIDSHCVCRRIVDLLFKSFFPVSESEREWCCRCITLIQMSPGAARKFYQHAHKHTAPTNIIKLMLAIRRVLNRCIQSEGDRDANEGGKESGAAEPLLGKDTALVSRLLEVVVILWRSVEKALRQNQEALKYTLAKFGNVLAKYFQAFEDDQCTAALVQLASLMPPAAVPTFSCGVLSRLRRMEAGSAPVQYNQLLDCMCSWGQASNVVELVTDWLAEALPKQRDKPTARRRVRIQETAEAKPDVALVYLEYLLSHRSAREKVLDLGERPLKQLHAVLGSWRSVLLTRLGCSTADPKLPGEGTALGVFVFHGRLSAHLQHRSSEGREYLLSLEHVAAWLAERVLPLLTKHPNGNEEEEEEEEEEGRPEKPRPLAAQITESFLTVCRDVLLVGLADGEFKGQILHLCSLILLSEAGYRCIPAVLPVLKEVVDGCAPEDDDEEDPNAVLLGVVANIFQKIIELLARCVRKGPAEGKRLSRAAVPSLAHFLQAAQMRDSAPLRGIFSTLFAVVIVEKGHLLQKIAQPAEAIAPESVEDMPPLSSVLLSVILKSPPVTRAFLKEVGSSLDSGAIGSLYELAAILHVLSVVTHAGKAEVKHAAASVQQRLHTHAVSSSEDGDVQRAIYESSVKTLNQILDL